MPIFTTIDRNREHFIAALHFEAAADLAEAVEHAAQVAPPEATVRHVSALALLLRATSDSMQGAV